MSVFRGRRPLGVLLERALLEVLPPGRLRLEGEERPRCRTRVERQGLAESQRERGDPVALDALDADAAALAPDHEIDREPARLADRAHHRERPRADVEIRLEGPREPKDVHPEPEVPALGGGLDELELLEAADEPVEGAPGLFDERSHLRDRQLPVLGELVEHLHALLHKTEP